MIKKYKIISFVFLAVFLVLIIGFGTYRVMSVNNNGKQSKIKEKTEKEIQYIDENLIKIFNKMNNIEYESYKISVNTVNTENKEETNQNGKDSTGSNLENSNESSTGNNQKENSSSSEENNTTGNASSSEENNTTVNESSSDKNTESIQKKYNLQEEGILTQKEEIDWKEVKNNIEKIYVSIPTITLDLYQTNITDQNILNFNTEYDNLTKIIQGENKTDTLKQLCKIYEIYVKFIEENDSSEQEKTIAKTKLNIFKAYSSLDEEKWDEISNHMRSASEEFSKLMTSTDMKEEKQYGINKAYIMINELYKSANVKDSKIFLIKYKNTLEEFKNL